MAGRYVNIKITINWVDKENGPQQYITGLIDKAVVLMESLANQQVDYSLVYKIIK